MGLSYITKLSTISHFFGLTFLKRGIIYVSGGAGFYPQSSCMAIVEYSSIILKHRKTIFNIWRSGVSLTKSSNINYSRIHFTDAWIGTFTWLLCRIKTKFLLISYANLTHGFITNQFFIFKDLIWDLRFQYLSIWFDLKTDDLIWDLRFVI